MLPILHFVRRHPFPILLLALPWLLLAINPNWPFANGGNCDPWFYYGHFTNYPHLYQLRPCYDGERLPLILPGCLFHALFKPVVGEVLLHTTFFYLAVFSLYYTLSKLHDQRTALLTGVLLGCHSFFLGSMGWDYGDGLGNAYYLLAIAFLTRALTACWPFVWIGLSGVASAALFSTYPLWLLFMPFFAFYYTIPSWRSGRRSLWSAFLFFALFFTIGFAGLTVLFALLNHWVGGDYNFYKWSLQTMSAVTDAPEWSSFDFGWIKRATWDVFPLMTFFACIVYVLAGRWRVADQPSATSWLFLANFAYCFLAFSYLTFIKGHRLLEFDYYTSNLLPAMFLVLGSVFLQVPCQVRLPGFLVVVGAAFSICVLPLWKSWSYPEMLTDIAFAQKYAWVANYYLVGCGIVGSCGLVLRSLFRGCRLSWLVCLFGLCAAGLGLTPAYTQAPWITGYRGPAFYARVDQALAVVKMQTGLETPPFFWFSLTDKETLDYLAIARSLRAHRAVDWSFPALAPGVAIPADSVVLVLTEKRELPGTAADALRRAGLNGRVFTQIRIGDRLDSYWMTFLSVSKAETTTSEPPPRTTKTT